MHLIPQLALIASLGLAPLGSMRAADVLLDAAEDAGGWAFHDGGEFPGASGSLRRGDTASGIQVDYDFTRGGTYVAAIYRGPVPPQTTAFRLTVQASQDCQLFVRISDASKRTFQGGSVALAAGESRELTCPVAGPWKTAWGGVDGARPGEVGGFTLCVSKESPVATGRLVIGQLHADSAAPAAELSDPVVLQDPDFDLAGWRFSGRWIRQYRRPVLAAVVRGSGPAGELVVSMPRQQRDWNVRVRLPAEGPDHAVRLTPPVGMANPRASYALEVAFAGDDVHASRRIALPGTAAEPATLGAPRTTRELPPSPFGTCMHLAYGRSGAFAGWKASDRLLDEAAAAGLSWIRDGANLVKGTDGSYAIDPYDRAWLAAAKQRGLRTIIVVGMGADQPVEELCARAQAVARAADLVDAIELGNEPNNFGGWVKTYGGKWNGMADDGGVAGWVKAHLVATNAMAEAVKAVRPAVPVIALGSPPPANARALDIGLSPAVDGVVDHPYSYCLPPELVPWSTSLAARDGIAVGDAAGTTVGLFEWYDRKHKALGRNLATWVTEFGWSTKRQDLKNTGNLYCGVTEEVQAAYLVERHLLHAWHGVAASVQYEMLDDYGSAPGDAEANFGLLRSDYSRKPAWHAIRRMCSVFAGAVPDRDASAEIVQAPLHRGQQRGTLVADWDKVEIKALSGIQALPFAHPGRPGMRTLALWSELPRDPNNGRAAVIAVRGWNGLGAPVAIGLCSGRITDVERRVEGDTVQLTVHLDDEPLAIRAFAE